jgi:hypothetical protein
MIGKRDYAALTVSFGILRDTLFLRIDKLRTETPTGPASVLHDRMIMAFDKAIEPHAD